MHAWCDPVPATIVTATLPSKSHESHVPDAMYIRPSGVRVIFWTCFAISARAIRGSPVDIDCKWLRRPSTNRLASRSRTRIALGAEYAIFALVSASSCSNSASFSISEA